MVEKRKEDDLRVIYIVRLYYPKQEYNPRTFLSNRYSSSKTDVFVLLEKDYI